MMTLPYLQYQDFEKVKAYYLDPEFSLNNLGEGLYGWMKKIERNSHDVKLWIRNSRGGTCFVHVLHDPAYQH